MILFFKMTIICVNLNYFIFLTYLNFDLQVIIWLIRRVPTFLEFSVFIFTNIYLCLYKLYIMYIKVTFSHNTFQGTSNFLQIYSSPCNIPLTISGIYFQNIPKLQLDLYQEFLGHLSAFHYNDFSCF
jgi:hypothetical protein